MPRYQREVILLLKEILAELKLQNVKENIQMADLTRLTAQVQANTTVGQSAITLINGLAEQIRNLPADQAAIDALASQIETDAAALGAAVLANTPTPPEPSA